jgi:hypothetical protein
MPCVICGHQKTVRSHLIPRALAFEIRGQETNLTILERGADRPKALPAGLFDKNLLCADHEQTTGELDRYGVEFVRRVQAGRSTSNGQAFTVANPDPSKLARFAHSIVWRAVASPIGNTESQALGARIGEFRDSIFLEKHASTVLFCASVRFEHEGRVLRTAMMPIRSREQGRWIWKFELSGCFFTLLVGGCEFSRAFDVARADRAEQVCVPHLPTDDALGWEGMKSVIQSIKRHPRVSCVSFRK